MDIVRPKAKRHRTRLIVIGGAVLVLLTTLGLSQLKPAAPEIERATLLIDAVKRGPMLRQVHANGILVPRTSGSSPRSPPVASTRSWCGRARR